MILTVPQDAVLYPTLGPLVCDWAEANLVFGPGDLRGQPYVFDEEKRALVYRMYEVFPQRHEHAGRRRFKRAGLSLRKGLAKTELAAIIAACELHPDAPVRCVGWTKKGEPIGGPVSDPYIPLVAYTEEQSDELAYGALRVILDEGPLRNDFDIGLERIIRKNGDGKAVSLSSSPNARDGARTTFAVMDETHWWTLPRLKQAHQTMINNLAKRKLADPWMLEVTTAPEPGAGSVAEATMDYAQAVSEGRVTDSSLFYFHRQAGDEHDLTTREGARAAVIEASGSGASWTDVDAIVSIWNDPTTDRSFWERVWTNRLVKHASQAFDVEQWKLLKRPVNPVKAGDLITLGFDGAQFHDSTGIVATHIATGYQWVAGLWECPAGRDDWQVPAAEVDALMRSLFTIYNVWRLYADPPYWQSWIAAWAGEFDKGRADKDKRVIEWWTNRRKQMSVALENFESAIKEGTISHDGDERLIRHIGNSRRKDLPGWKDEQGRSLWLIQKERPDSPHKIDLAMAAALSWEARTDAIASGVSVSPEYQTLFFGGRRSSPAHSQWR
jgi:phage terminase large subunit-like protein